MLFSVFRVFVRGTYIGHQLSWGKNKAMFFTRINIGLILAIITLPLSVYVSVGAFNNLSLIVGIVPVVSGVLYIMVSNKWMADESLYPDAQKMNVTNIKREKFYSNLIYFFVSVLFIILSWWVAYVHHK
ncbi:hypothetical protein G3R49_04690 [Shewanella sp. WXL01]|uniref:hypothetical protein n=1 Tax=Shewanella sp. WXL01 TaxID=2709721 RepID=UPI00143835EE|nr:hypothetical protein [Shewanella sp. WXL01]NKF49869.1 hypothetical protein [Shewanella sp. WXL01]